MDSRTSKPKSGVAIWILALLFASAAFAAEPKKHAWDCLTVKLSKVDDDHYLMESQNTCEQSIENAVVLVKFFDGKWNRIGVGYFAAFYVAPGERLRKRFPAPSDVRGFAHVGVRAIKEDPAEALK
jgi:hypothetical protein